MISTLIWDILSLKGMWLYILQTSLAFQVSSSTNYSSRWPWLMLPPWLWNYEPNDKESRQEYPYKIIYPS